VTAVAADNLLDYTAAQQNKWQTNMVDPPVNSNRRCISCSSLLAFADWHGSLKSVKQQLLLLLLGVRMTGSLLFVYVPSSPADEYDASGIITPKAYAAHAQNWAAAGAELIGGCCGVGPQHMAAVAAAVCV
jgi:hypothetical protein